MSILDEVENMTDEEFEALSDAKKLQWYQELVKEFGKHSVLAVPSAEVQARWKALGGHEEDIVKIDDGETRTAESNGKPEL